jgi:hypothetical protein
MAMRYLSRQHQGNEAGLFGLFYEIHESDRHFTAGETGAAGIRFRAGRAECLPQFRYARWSASGILSESNEAENPSRYCFLSG